MKCAVYVEGKAEMLFVADVLAKYSDYDPSKIGFKCITLNKDVLKPVSHPAQGDELSSSSYYQIVNVNNDDLVVSKLKKDIPNLAKQGYEIIIGLRDVFGEGYKALIQNQEIDLDLIREMHDVQYDQIKNDCADIRLHFAIMEYEAWMLALIDNFIISKGGNPDSVFKSVGIDYNSDFEKTVFHPYIKVEKIFQSIGEHYGKHESDYYSFLNTLTKTDYETLRNSNRCVSFKLFIDSLLSIVMR